MFLPLRQRIVTTLFFVACTFLVAAQPTIFAPGELLILGINANNTTGACGGSITGEDRISFFCLKPITNGTTFILTDNGYERSSSQPAGRWGNTEGVVRMTRTGATIPAGQVITFRFNLSPNTTNVASIAPDANWSCAYIGLSGAVNMNNGGDQIFFMQGGTWNNGTFNLHNATYTGTVLNGFSTTGVWESFGNSTQKSGLPATTACFFISPTTNTDYNKYIGPQSIASWRDWIVRVGTTANWSTSATINSCATYNSAAPNWNLAPTLPIDFTTPTAGRWLGTTDTDWFNCKNWDDTVVPDLTTPVEINPAYAINDCVVGLTASGTAQCASLLQTSNGTVRQLTIQNNSTLTINGPLQINRTALGGSLTTTVLDNSTLSCSELSISGLTVGATNEAILRCESPLASVQIESDLMINTGGLLDLQGSIAGGNLMLGGDWTNTESEANFQDQYSIITLLGNGDQNLSTASGPEVFGSLVLDKTGGDLLLNSQVQVRNDLLLTTGRIITGSNLVTMFAGSTTTGANDNSFVTGRVRKLGSAAFIFPVGKGNNFQPIAIGAGGVASDSFVAEYLQTDPDPDANDAITSPLDHISACEYWNLEREVGSANRAVTLTWDANSCGVTDMADLRVAHFNAATPAWFDRGGTVVGGSTLASGSVTSGLNTLFGPFTLSSTSSENPLPITLLSFTGRAMGNDAILLWTTASEQENAYFELLASGPDKGVWEELLPIGRVAGGGTSFAPLDYGFVDDRPNKRGTYYYQLRQVDFDGTSTVSQVITVEFGKGGLADPVVWPNPFSTDATVLLDAPAPGTLQVQLRNALGQTIGSTSFAVEQGSFTFQLGDLAPVAQGVYFLELSIGEFRTLTRVVRQ
jgi:hypothetical protein